MSRKVKESIERLNVVLEPRASRIVATATSGRNHAPLLGKALTDAKRNPDGDPELLAQYISELLGEEVGNAEALERIEAINGAPAIPVCSHSHDYADWLIYVGEEVPADDQEPVGKREAMRAIFGSEED